MLAGMKPLSIFRNQYVFFITTVIITIIVNQVIIQSDLNQQNQDAQLINVAGRQRMLSQRIAKRVLYTRDILDDKGAATSGALDTLRFLIDEFERIHFSLLEGHNGSGVDYKKSSRIDSLLKANTSHL